MSADTVLALIAVITAGQVTSVAIGAILFRRLATRAIHAAAATTPQEYAMLEKLAQKPRKRTAKSAPPIPFGL